MYVLVMKRLLGKMLLKLINKSLNYTVHIIFSNNCFHVAMIQFNIVLFVKNLAHFSPSRFWSTLRNISSVGLKPLSCSYCGFVYNIKLLLTAHISLCFSSLLDHCHKCMCMDIVLIEIAIELKPWSFFSFTTIYIDLWIYHGVDKIIII